MVPCSCKNSSGVTGSWVEKFKELSKEDPGLSQQSFGHLLLDKTTRMSAEKTAASLTDKY